MPTANSLDEAIRRLQTIAKACTNTRIRNAPTYPIEQAGVLPMGIAHLVSGQGVFTSASTLHFFPTAQVDFIMSRENLEQAYKESDAIALEFMQRLHGDPTLGGNVETVIATRDQPVTFEVGPMQWNDVTMHVLSFTIPLKLMKAPTT